MSYKLTESEREQFLANAKLLLKKQKAFSVDWQNVIRQVTIEESSNTRKTRDSYQLKEQPMTLFVTGSEYKGTWSTLGMHGTGVYDFFYKVKYDGHFFDNMFHGQGQLWFPNNGRMEGNWEKGHMISHRYYFDDNLSFGPYCQMPDRRFHLEYRYGIKPAGRSLKTNSYSSKIIPPGCYDTVDGFYDPKRRCVYSYEDLKKIIRIPTNTEHEWIKKNCRKAWDEPVGYRPDLYENWNLQNEDDQENEAEVLRNADLVNGPVSDAELWKVDFKSNPPFQEEVI